MILPTYLTPTTIQFIGEFLGLVLPMDAFGFCDGLVRVKLSLSRPAHLPCRFRVSLIEVLSLKFKYERLLGLYVS